MYNLTIIFVEDLGFSLLKCPFAHMSDNEEKYPLND